MQRHQILALLLAIALVAGCRTQAAAAAPVPMPTADTGSRRARSWAMNGRPWKRRSTPGRGLDPPRPRRSSRARGIPLAPNAPDSYVVKRGDTLWGIAKVFLRDPWYWPEIWQVNPQVQNPHLIYPGDTLRLVYIDGRPRIVLQPGLQRGNGARVMPRVRSQPLEAAVTTIPYETIAAFMSKPSVLDKDQIKLAPYVLATRDQHVVMAEGDTVYARGFKQPVEARHALQPGARRRARCAIRTTTASWDTTACTPAPAT